MFATNEYAFFENVYDVVQREHDRLTGMGAVGFVSAFIDAGDIFTTITRDVIDARATIDALASDGAHFYVIGADIRENA